MYTATEYEKLEEKYGQYSSWAIWNENDQKDTTLIKENFKELNTNYVFLGLNISEFLGKPLWSNFHIDKNGRIGRHDRKLMFACNDSKLRGSYITDIFKDLPIAKASEVKKYIKEHPEVIPRHVDFFNKEMIDINSDKNTVFIVLGADSSFLLKCFNEHFKNKIKGMVLNIRHYSSPGTDEDWVNELWSIKEIGINKIFKKEEWLKSKQNKA